MKFLIIAIVMAISLPTAAADLDTTTREAKQGIVSSQVELAKHYIRDSDFKRAMFWLAEAKRQGNPDAQTLIGYMYHTGAGMEPNLKLAQVWYVKAANQGHKEALEMLNILNRTYNTGAMILKPKD